MAKLVYAYFFSIPLVVLSTIQFVNLSNRRLRRAEDNEGRLNDTCRPFISFAKKPRIDWIQQLELDFYGKNDSLILYKRSSAAGTQAGELCDVVKGRRIVVTYKTQGGNFGRLASTVCEKAIAIPGIDACLIIGYNFLDDHFKRQYAAVVDSENGYWLWKPYILWRLLVLADQGDVVFYLDPDMALINSIEDLVCIQAAVNQDIVVFPSYNPPLQEYLYTKADAFLIMNVEKLPRVGETAQIYGSYLLLRKSLNSIRFTFEWLLYCQDKRVSGDAPSQIRQEKPDFIQSLHDQSVLSLLSKKWNIPSWPSPELCWACETDFSETSFQLFNSLPKLKDLKAPSEPIIGRLGETKDQ